MAHKLTCIITGKITTVSDANYQKKITEFDGVENLESMYVSRQSKNLLKRGYKVKEIRDLLKIDESKVMEIPEKKVREILKLQNPIEFDFDNISINKSDPEVSIYIENLRII